MRDPGIVMKSNSATTESKATAGRVAGLDWGTVAAELDDQGSAVIGLLLTLGQCDELAANGYQGFSMT